HAGRPWHRTRRGRRPAQPAADAGSRRHRRDHRGRTPDAAMTQRLTVLLDGEEAGRVERDSSGRTRLTYGDTWRQSEKAYPLSLSMPLTAATHGQAKVDPFLWGLLPDNRMVLDRWARRFQTSARNAFSLLAHVGEDCAGAAQFVRPDRLEAVS